MIKTKNYVGLFLITMATLMLEILLTRIFSVTMWYHFGFMVISLAMFGMTVGALSVYLYPNFFDENKANFQMSISAYLFSISVLISFFFHLLNPVKFHLNLLSILANTFHFSIISLPFIFSGICVCIALTKFPKNLSKLYAADLIGAALGCLLLVVIINFTDAQTSVLFTALIAAVASYIFYEDRTSQQSKNRTIVSIYIILLTVFAIYNAFEAIQGTPFLKILWTKDFEGKAGERIASYEKWNSFSRVIVFGNPNKPERPFGWAFSKKYEPKYLIDQLSMEIDNCAGTVITRFDGKNKNNLEHLKYDISNVVHYLRNDSTVAIIGVGGGRDILSSLVFNQKQIVGIEINNNILDIVNNKFGSFSGHLDKNNKVMFINDEARSYITRNKKNYDIIQVSLIDTFAASSVGAFALSENALYTVEAWQSFLKRLSNRGILSFTRWYVVGWPEEMYRLTALARESLLNLGIKDIKNHIIIIINENYKDARGIEVPGVGTILVSKAPFSQEDLNKINVLAQKLDYKVILSPQVATHTVFDQILNNEGNFIDKYPYDISAPTDNRPFFFNMYKFKNLFVDPVAILNLNNFNANFQATIILIVLLIVTTILTLIFIVVPLLIGANKLQLSKVLPYVLFFASIGLGFMFIELSQMQRLIIFLGHPVYSLVVVLFTLLLSSGLGSYLTNTVKQEHLRKNTITLLILLLLVLGIFGYLTPYAINTFRDSINIIRILMAVVLLFPIGVLMGTAFPLGMRISSENQQSITPWLWGINGAASVSASAIAIIISMAFSINIAFWVGTICYLLALCSFILITRIKITC